MDYDIRTEKLFSIFPHALVSELRELSADGRRLSEIRLRRTGRSSVIIRGQTLSLSYSAAEDIDSVFSSVCRGSPYAYRDSVAEGYVPFSHGIRVGVSGRARYNEGRLTGVCDISVLVFRIPTGECDFSREILDIWRKRRGGVLIFSPPGSGKTTALRSLAKSLSSGSRPLRVVVVDEREEFVAEDFSGLDIDVLAGYKRALGISLATRTLNPEVIITDEICAADADALLSGANAGVPIVASAHAGSIDELFRRAEIQRLVSCGVFGTFAEVSSKAGRFFCRQVYPAQSSEKA